MALLNLTPLRAFDDNYIWMLDDGQQALVVDPGAAAPVLQALEHQALRLAGILVTHHHGDHVGGLAQLVAACAAPVWAPATEAMPVAVQACRDGDRLGLLGQSLRVLEVPGHTRGHIAFMLDAPGDGSSPLLFCGDTLFSGGCGRLFEGTPAQMLHSLQRLAALPGDTRVCCAHEYTLSNLRFAQTIAPDNKDLRDYRAWCEARRAQDLPTLPSSLAQELRINPFLRCEQAEVRSAVQQQAALADDADIVAVFAALREWKNHYR